VNGLADIITPFIGTDGNTRQNMNTKFAQANAEFARIDAAKANKSITAPVTLTAAGWVDNQQTLSVDGATATNIIEIAVDKAATLEQEAAFYAAALKDGGQDDGTITLNVSGRIPSVDIPILVIARGDL